VPIDAFEHSFVVDAQPDAIYRHLSDPNSYVGLTPPVVEVRDIRLGQDDDRHNIIEYVAVERFRAGKLLHWDSRSNVLLTLTRPGVELVSSVIGPGGVRLRARVTLDPAPQGTQVRETIEVNSPAPLRRFAVGRARAAQLKRAEELTRRMARRR